MPEVQVGGEEVGKEVVTLPPLKIQVKGEEAGKVVQPIPPEEELEKLYFSSIVTLKIS